MRERRGAATQHRPGMLGGGITSAPGVTPGWLPGAAKSPWRRVPWAAGPAALRQPRYPVGVSITGLALRSVGGLIVRNLTTARRCSAGFSVCGFDPHPPQNVKSGRGRRLASERGPYPPYLERPFAILGW